MYMTWEYNKYDNIPHLTLSLGNFMYLGFTPIRLRQFLDTVSEMHDGEVVEFNGVTTKRSVRVSDDAIEMCWQGVWYRDQTVRITDTLLSGYGLMHSLQKI